MKERLRVVRFALVYLSITALLVAALLLLGYSLFVKGHLHQLASAPLVAVPLIWMAVRCKPFHQALDVVFAPVHWLAFGRNWKKAREEILEFRHSPRLQKPPGRCLHRLAGFLFSRRTFELVLEPQLSDMELEYCDALAQGKKRQAAWARIRGTFNFFTTVAAQLPVSATRVICAVWKATR